MFQLWKHRQLTGDKLFDLITVSVYCLVTKLQAMWCHFPTKRHILEQTINSFFHIILYFVKILFYAILICGSILQSKK
jgi:ethanolamine transporter EutH